MNFNNSSSTISAERYSSTKNLSTLVSFFKRFNLTIIIIILVVLIFSLIIFISLCISKYKRKQKKNIVRQNIIIKKHCASKADILEDPQMSLLEQNYGGMIKNIRIISTDPIDESQIIDASLDTPRDSTLSVSSQHISITNPSNETNHNDELFDLDFTNIPLRPLNLSNNNLTDPSLLKGTNHSSHDSLEHPYIVAQKQQERKEIEDRIQYIKDQISTGSTATEESCF